MNEKKSVKLHKSHKIICFIVCFVIVFGITSVVAFAYTFILPAGSTFSYEPTFVNDPTHIYYFPSSVITSGSRLEYPIDASVQVGDYTYDVYSVFFDSVFDADGYLSLVSFGFTYDFFGETQDIIAVSNSYDDGIFASSDAFNLGVVLTVNSSFSYDYIFDDFLRNNVPPFEYTSPPPEYEGNPFLDIVDYVFDALDVRLFGYFSILDVLKVFLAMNVFVWLLKVLAGG